MKDSFSQNKEHIIFVKKYWWDLFFHLKFCCVLQIRKTFFLLFLFTFSFLYIFFSGSHMCYGPGQWTFVQTVNSVHCFCQYNWSNQSHFYVPVHSASLHRALYWSPQFSSKYKVHEEEKVSKIKKCLKQKSTWNKKEMKQKLHKTKKYLKQKIPETKKCLRNNLQQKST